MGGSNKDNNKDGTDGGAGANKCSIKCLFCRCKRNSHHKENDEVVVDVVDNRSSFEMGHGGSPDDGILKPQKTNQVGSVETCDTGWRDMGITTE